MLSGVKIVDMDTLKQAIAALHEQYRVPHILITSVSLPSPGVEPHLSVVGSTLTSTAAPRIFRVTVPAIDCHFNGTGDMFAALMVVRFREAVTKTEGLVDKASWISDDAVTAAELPLAKATEKVLASMHSVLLKTKEKKDAEVEKYTAKTGGNPEDDPKQYKLVVAKASEVTLIRNLELLRNPPVHFTAEHI
jgi:pyridoxine kinase